MTIRCSSVALHLTHEDLHAIHGIHFLMCSDLLPDLISNIPFQGENFSHEMKCVLYIHSEHKDPDHGACKGQTKPAYIEKIISWSRLPRLNDAFEFLPPIEELIEALNMDLEYGRHFCTRCKFSIQAALLWWTIIFFSHQHPKRIQGQRH